jgi:AraC family transcriptional regulator
LTGSERPDALEPGKYLGRELRRLEGRRFTLTESAYASDTRLPEHSHTRAHYCLVVTGRYTERLADREHPRRPGDLVFYPAGSRHAEIHHETGRHLMIDIDTSLLDRAARMGEIPRSVGVCGPQASRTAERMIGELHRSATAAALVLEGLTLELLGHTVRQREAPPSSDVPGWLLEALEAAQAAMPEPPTLEGLARRAGVHPTHFSRTMRLCRGESYGEMVRRLRLDRARRLLSETELPLAEVALESGYCDQSHLTRTFRAELETTPAAFRRSRR